MVASTYVQRTCVMLSMPKLDLCFTSTSTTSPWPLAAAQMVMSETLGETKSVARMEPRLPPSVKTRIDAPQHTCCNSIELCKLQLKGSSHAQTAHCSKYGLLLGNCSLLQPQDSKPDQHSPKHFSCTQSFVKGMCSVELLPVHGCKQSSVALIALA